MNELVLAGLLMLIMLDAQILRAQSNLIFERIFNVSIWQTVLLFVLTATYCFISLINVKFLIAYNIVFILPLYLLRREKFYIQTREAALSDNKYRLSYSAFEVIFLWIYILTIFSISMQIVQLKISIFPTELVEVLFINMISSIIILILIARSVIDWPGKTFLSSVGCIRNNQSLVKLIVLPAMAGVGCAFFSALSVISRKVQPSTPLSEMLEAQSTVGTIAIFIMLAVVFAPLIEEITFRGYFFTVLDKVKGRIFAFIFISLSFGILHFQQYWGDWQALSVVTALGFILTGVRIWTGSVIGSVVMHYFYNGGVIVLTVMLLAINDPFYFEFQLKKDDLNFTEKEELLKKSITNDFKNEDAYNDLAREYAKENIHLEEALAFIKKALSVDPANKTYIETKADVLEQMGRYDEAIDLRKYLLRNSSFENVKEKQVKHIKKLEDLKVSTKD